MTLVIRELDDEEFQDTFEACGDSDPYGLVLDGEVIGFVLTRYNADARDKLAKLGIEIEE